MSNEVAETDWRLDLLRRDLPAKIINLKPGPTVIDALFLKNASAPTCNPSAVIEEFLKSHLALLEIIADKFSGEEWLLLSGSHSPFSEFEIKTADPIGEIKIELERYDGENWCDEIVEIKRISHRILNLTRVEICIFIEIVKIVRNMISDDPLFSVAQVLPSIR